MELLKFFGHLGNDPDKMQSSPEKPPSCTLTAEMIESHDASAGTLPLQPQSCAQACIDESMYNERRSVCESEATGPISPGNLTNRTSFTGEPSSTEDRRSVGSAQAARTRHARMWAAAMRKEAKKEARHRQKVVQALQPLQEELRASQEMHQFFRRAELEMQISKIMIDKRARTSAASVIQATWRAHHVRAKIVPDTIKELLLRVFRKKPHLMKSRTRLEKYLRIQSLTFRVLVRNLARPLAKNACASCIIKGWRRNHLQRVTIATLCVHEEVRTCIQQVAHKLASGSMGSAGAKLLLRYQHFELGQLQGTESEASAQTDSATSSWSGGMADAANAAAKVFRDMKRKEAEKQIMKKVFDLSSAVVQAHWRMQYARLVLLPRELAHKVKRSSWADASATWPLLFARHIGRVSLQLRSACAAKIQTMWKVSLSSRRQAATSYVRSLVHRCWSGTPTRRKNQVMLFLRSRHVDELKTAGGFSSSKAHMLRNDKEHRSRAAVIVQAYVRGYRIRARPLPMMRIRVKAVWRQHPQRSSMESMDFLGWKSATIQALVRRHLPGIAALVIQCFWRLNSAQRHVLAAAYVQRLDQRIRNSIGESAFTKVVIKLQNRALDRRRSEKKGSLTRLSQVGTSLATAVGWRGSAEVSLLTEEFRNRSARILQAWWRASRVRRTTILTLLGAAIDSAWRSDVTILNDPARLHAKLGLKSRGMQRRADAAKPLVVSVRIQRRFRKHLEWLNFQRSIQAYARDLSMRLWGKFSTSRKSKVLILLRNRRVTSLQDCLANDRVVSPGSRGGAGLKKRDMQNRAMKKIFKIQQEPRHQERAVKLLQAWWRGCIVREFLDARGYGCGRDLRFTAAYIICLQHRLQRRKRLQGFAQKARDRWGGEDGIFMGTILEQKMRVLARMQYREQQRTYQDIFRGDACERIILPSISSEDAHHSGGCDHDWYFREKVCRAVEKQQRGDPVEEGHLGMAVDKEIVDFYMEQQKTVAVKCQSFVQSLLTKDDLDPEERTFVNSIAQVDKLHEMPLPALDQTFNRLDRMVAALEDRFPESDGEEDGRDPRCLDEAQELNLAVEVARNGHPAALVRRLRGIASSFTRQRILRSLEFLSASKLQALYRGVHARQVTLEKVARRYSSGLLKAAVRRRGNPDNPWLPPKLSESLDLESPHAKEACWGAVTPSTRETAATERSRHM